jgi:hypothetical protein
MPSEVFMPDEGVTKTIVHDQKQLLAKIVCLAAGEEIGPEDQSLGSFL